MGVLVLIFDTILRGMSVKLRIYPGEATAEEHMLEDFPVEKQEASSSYLLCQPSPLGEADHCPI